MISISPIRHAKVVSFADANKVLDVCLDGHFQTPPQDGKDMDVSRSFGIAFKDRYL